MKTVDIRKLKTSELTTEITKMRIEIAEMRRRVHMGESTGVRALRAQRKDLARMLTVLSEQLAKENI